MEELKELSKEIKTLQKKAKHLNQLRNKLLEDEKELQDKYNIQYAKLDWEKKLGKYFRVKGFHEEDFFCHVIDKVDNKINIEYFEVGSKDIFDSVVDDPREDCGYRLWVEISKDEYEKAKLKV